MNTARSSSEKVHVETENSERPWRGLREVPITTKIIATIKIIAKHFSTKKAYS